MNILVMGDYQPNPHSGASGTEWQMVEALRTTGHQVDTVWADELKHYIRHGNFHYLLELPVSYRIALLNKFALKQYDVVHVSQPHGYLAAKTTMERYKNSVFIHRSHGFEGRVAYELNRWTKDFYQDNRSIMKRYLSNCLGKLLNIHNMLIARFATGHIVSASECKDFMRLEYGISEERIAIIPQAPPDDYHFYPVPSLDSERLRRVLYVGQYAFVKAPMILARTIERLLETRPEVYFTWVCGKQHHAEAQALFSNRSILSRINFEGWCDQMSLRSIYDQHGIFLFPSFFEGFGKAFIEAMSRGLVVVAANNGGMKDVITDGKNGILIETGDDRAMARACAYLIENPDLASAISNEGRRHANNYTWRRVADETIDFYQRLLSALDYGQTHHRDGSC